MLNQANPHIYAREQAGCDDCMQHDNCAIMDTNSHITATVLLKK